MDKFGDTLGEGATGRNCGALDGTNAGLGCGGNEPTDLNCITTNRILLSMTV